MIRRCLAVALALALVVAVSACGNKQATITHADTEGVYVDLGNLQYQIQISRQLNPADVEDSGYVHGVADRLGPGDVWFGVFVRVQNSTNQVQRPARRFVITDTLNNTFTPVAINKYSNPYAY